MKCAIRRAIKALNLHRPIINYFIEYAGKVYSFLGYSSAKNFQVYLSEFQQTAESFQPVRDARILQVEPARLAIVPADRNAPFRQFLSEQLPPGMNPLDLAILNQVELDDPIPRGKKLKLPRSIGFQAESLH
jgi:hypothetical protein